MKKIQISQYYPGENSKERTIWTGTEKNKLITPKNKMLNNTKRIITL